LEELMLINGIKEAKYNKIKDYICLWSIITLN
jgi:hypothetical protein